VETEGSRNSRMEESSALICGVKRRLTPTSSRVTVPVVVEVCVVVAELEVAALVTSLIVAASLFCVKTLGRARIFVFVSVETKRSTVLKLLASRTPSVICDLIRLAGVVVSTAVKSAAEVDPGHKSDALCDAGRYAERKRGGPHAAIQAAESAVGTAPIDPLIGDQPLVHFQHVNFQNDLGRGHVHFFEHLLYPLQRLRRIGDNDAVWCAHPARSFLRTR